MVKNLSRILIAGTLDCLSSFSGEVFDVAEPPASRARTSLRDRAARAVWSEATGSLGLD